MSQNVDAHIIQTVQPSPAPCESVPLQLPTTHQVGLIDIMQRQNEITAMLVQRNLSSALPPRNIPVFDGDPLEYMSFIRAFENGVEAKTSNWSDCLHLLEQIHQGAAERPGP